MSKYRFLVINFVFFSLFISSIITLPKTVEATEMWSQTYGGTEFDTASSLVETSDGGYAIIGRTESFGAGSADCWLIKTDISGNMEWNQTYGGIQEETASELVKTSDGGYCIVGGGESVRFGPTYAWLVKTDVSGNMEWNQTFDGTEDEYFTALIETPDGGYAIAGYTSSFGAGDRDVWLIKTDEYGIIPEFPSWTLILLTLVVLAIIWLFTGED